MNRVAKMIVSFVAALLSTIAVADERGDVQDIEAVSIPLNEVWGFGIPGTRNLQKVESRDAAEQVDGIRRVLSTPPPQGKEAIAGFAVVGTGLGALREAHAVLVDGKKPRPTLPANSELSIVFFSFQFGPYVHLDKITRRGNAIEVRYMFVPHKTEEVTEHFALIPIGKLGAGKVQVEITQSPMERKFIEAGWKDVKHDTARRIVCGSFSFDSE